MPRHPPNSPLFPYTTLFGSAQPRSEAYRSAAEGQRWWCASATRVSKRSEEHTSERQSPLHLQFNIFFLNAPAPPEFSPLSLHDALRICPAEIGGVPVGGGRPALVVR